MVGPSPSPMRWILLRAAQIVGGVLLLFLVDQKRNGVEVGPPVDFGKGRTNVQHAVPLPDLFPLVRGLYLPSAAGGFPAPRPSPLLKGRQVGALSARFVGH